MVQHRALLAAQDAYVNVHLPLPVAAVLDVVAAGSFDADGGGDASLLPLSTPAAAAVGAALLALAALVALAARRRRAKRLAREHELTTRIGSRQHVVAAHGWPAVDDVPAGGEEGAGEGAAPAPPRTSSAAALAYRTDLERDEESLAGAATGQRALRHIAATYGTVGAHGSTATRPEEPDVLWDGSELSVSDAAAQRFGDTRQRLAQLESVDTLNSADLQLDLQT